MVAHVESGQAEPDTRAVRLARREGLIEALHRSRAEELDELHRAHRPDKVGSLVLSWLAAWLRGAERAVAEPLPEIGAGQVGVTWVGHATVRLRYPDLTILTDPMLSRRLGAVKRAVDPGLAPSELRDTDLILIGNAAPDLLHVPTLRRLPRAATIVVPPRCAGLVSDLGFARVVELAIGQSLRHRGVDVTATPARCETASGRASCSWVLRGDGPSVFVCGQTGYFSGFAEIGRRWRPDIAILPIGGYVPRSFRRDHMSPLDALYAFDDLESRLMIPIRWGSFALSYETLAEPVAWLRALVEERRLAPHVTILAPGASRKYEPPRDTPHEASAGVDADPVSD